MDIELDRAGSRDFAAQAAAGNRAAFDALCAPLRRRLLRHAFGLCRCETQAQDLAQETLLEAWKSIQRFNGQCQFSTWLCAILLRRHQSARRRARWRELLHAFTPGEPEPPAGQVDPDATAAAPDEAAELSERSRLILRALDRLPARQREVVFLRFYEDASLAEIAAALGCAAGTVKSRLFHALENLRAMQVFDHEFR